MQEKQGFIITSSNSFKQSQLQKNKFTTTVLCAYNNEQCNDEKNGKNKPKEISEAKVGVRVVDGWWVAGNQAAKRVRLGVCG